MVGYRLLIKPSAGKEIEAIALGSDPRPDGCEKIAGAEARYRVRQGQFRIICAIDDAKRTVEVFKVGHRREVYRGVT